MPDETSLKFMRIDPSVKIFDFDSSPFRGASAMWHLWCYCNGIAGDREVMARFYPPRYVYLPQGKYIEAKLYRTP